MRFIQLVDVDLSVFGDEEVERHECGYRSQNYRVRSHECKLRNQLYVFGFAECVSSGQRREHTKFEAEFNTFQGAKPHTPTVTAMTCPRLISIYLGARLVRSLAADIEFAVLSL